MPNYFTHWSEHSHKNDETYNKIPDPISIQNEAITENNEIKCGTHLLTINAQHGRRIGPAPYIERRGLHKCSPLASGNTFCTTNLDFPFKRSYESRPYTPYGSQQKPGSKIAENHSHFEDGWWCTDTVSIDTDPTRDSHFSSSIQSPLKMFIGVFFYFNFEEKIKKNS